MVWYVAIILPNNEAQHLSSLGTFHCTDKEMPHNWSGLLKVVYTLEIRIVGNCQSFIAIIILNLQKNSNHRIQYFFYEIFFKFREPKGLGTPQIPFLVIELEWTFYSVLQIPEAETREELRHLRWKMEKKKISQKQTAVNMPFR